MKEEVSEFEKLLKLDVSDKTEKKNNLTYLSWAFAWGEFVKVYPTASYEIMKNEKMMPYFKDESGAFCYTKVKAGNITHEMWLPVMDNRNAAVKNPDAMQVNKTVMRCLVKNLAMFGLGLYIYAGEDYPEGHEAPKTLREILTERGFTTQDIKDFGEVNNITNAAQADELVKHPLKMEQLIKSFHAQPKSA